MRDLRVNVGSIELQVREYEQEGDAIIFLHFGGGNLMMWQPVVSYFQGQYRLIFVDLRGHGKSDKPATGNHIDEMAQDIVGIMDHLKIQRAHIIGSSLGAEVGLSLAANYPEKVISLVCEGALYSEFGPYGIWEGSQAAFKEYVANQLENERNTPEHVFPTVDAMVSETRQVFEKVGWWNDHFEALTRYDAFKIDERKYTSGWRKQARDNYLEYYFEYRFEDYYNKIKCPVLMLPGVEELRNERIKTAMIGLCKLLPQGKIVEVPGWVHPYGWLLNPDETCKAILDFLAESR